MTSKGKPDDVDVTAATMRGVIGSMIEKAAKAPKERLATAIDSLVEEGRVTREQAEILVRLVAEAPAFVEALRHPSKAEAVTRIATLVAPVISRLAPNGESSGDIESYLRGALDAYGASGTHLVWRTVVEKDSARNVATLGAAIALSDFRSAGAWFQVARGERAKGRADTDDAAILAEAGMLAGECERLFERLAPRLRRIVLSDAGGQPRTAVETIYGLMLGEAVEMAAEAKRLENLTREETLAASNAARAIIGKRFLGPFSDRPVPDNLDPKIERTLRAAGLFEEPGPGDVNDGQFLLDALLLEELREFAGKEAAAALEELAPKHGKEGAPYRWWEPRDVGDAPRWAAYVAQVVWLGVVAPRIEKERRKPTALVRAVHQSALEFHSRVPKYSKDKRTLTFEGRELAAALGATFDADVIERGLELLGSVASHKLFRWEVMTGHDQTLRGVANPHVLDIEGGWSALAEAIGLDPRRPNMTANLRAIVHAQAHFAFKFPDGSRGNMLVYNERAARGRQTARVRIELGSVLLPDYVHTLPKGSAERRLVPLLREAVPLHGRPNEHGEQLTMSLAVLAELRARAAELAENGAVFLSHDDWTKLADRSGLKRSLILPVRERWLTGDGARAAPFLKQPKADRYTLAEVHRAELEFLVEAGKDETAGAKAGQKAAKRKRGKVRRLGNR